MSQVISLMLMWFSVGPVTPKLLDYKDAVAQCYGAYGQETTAAEECIRHLTFADPHDSLAILAFFLQHLLVLSGFFRPANNKLRNVQVILHSHLGYACWRRVAGVVAAFGEQDNCFDPRPFSIILIVIPLMFYSAGVGGVIKIGVIPPRKQWPVLEQLKLEGKSPCTVTKCIIFGVFTAIMLGIWVTALSSNLPLISGGVEITNSTKTGSPVITVGLFGCEIEAYG